MGQEQTPLQIGIYTDDRINRQLIRKMDVKGLLILGVEPGSVAESPVLQGPVQLPDGAAIMGDVLPGLDEHAISSSEELKLVLDLYQPGYAVIISLWRDG